MKKNSGEARRLIIDAAIAQFLQKGFNAASLNEIIGSTGLSKGAFYHHFDSREALLKAVLLERLQPWLRRSWEQPLRRSKALKATLIDLLKRQDRMLAHADQHLALLLGFLSNRSSLDSECLEIFQTLLRKWQSAIMRALLIGKRQGEIRASLRVTETSQSLISFFTGQALTSVCFSRIERRAQLRRMELLLQTLL